MSRFGLVAFASSLDQIGPLANNVEDVALAMNVIAGHDAMDSTSAPIEAPDFTAHLKDALKGKRIGLPLEFLVKGFTQK